MMKIVTLLLFVFTFLQSAEWIILQGTQSETLKADQLWGFGQLRYTHRSGDVYTPEGINKTPFLLNKPYLQSQNSLSLARFRIGLRGRLDRDNKINYFILTEFGDNGITNPLGERQNSFLTDLSLTLRYLPVNIRFGQFKYPGSEEGLMARFVSPFIAFTTISDQMMLERYLTPDSFSGSTVQGRPAHSVGAFRDSGVELFQSIEIDKRQRFTYAYMYGLGAGLQMDRVNDSEPTHYLYGAYENYFGAGKGYDIQSLKFYGWYQQGKRKLADVFHDRRRYGAGFTYFDGVLRVEGEYMEGEGMIFSGAKDIDPSFSQNEWLLEMETDGNSEADGYYLLATYRLSKELEALARYDVYDRMKNVALKKRVFQNTTVGLSYKLEGVNRVDLNYTFARAKAPHNPKAQEILDKMDNIARVQYTWVFK